MEPQTKQKLELESFINVMRDNCLIVKITKKSNMEEVMIMPLLFLIQNLKLVPVFILDLLVNVRVSFCYERPQSLSPIGLTVIQPVNLCLMT